MFNKLIIEDPTTPENVSLHYLVKYCRQVLNADAYKAEGSEGSW